MGKFGCTQIRTSSSCSSEKKKNVVICFLGLEYFAQRFNKSFDKNGQKKFDRYFYSLADIFGQKMGL